VIRCTRLGNFSRVTYTHNCNFFSIILEKASAVNGLANKITAVLLAIAMQLPTMNLALAQSSPDIRSPVIELEIIAEYSAGDTQEFTATVVEDKLLKDVFLYYRRAGRQPFNRIAMTQVDDSDVYRVSLDTDPTDFRTIEYYIQARDEGGNRTVEGYAFDPYSRVLIASETVTKTTVAPVTVSSDTTPTNANGRNIRWWHIVAGVVVVGAVVSLASSDSGESSADDDGNVPLTVNITGP